MLVITIDNITKVIRLNSQEMNGLFAQLVVAADNDPAPLTLTFREESQVYSYEVWQLIYGAVDWWFGEYMEEGPDAAIFV